MIFILRQISEAFKPLVENNIYKTASSYKGGVIRAEEDCDLSPINEETAERDFLALQYALFISLFIQVKVLPHVRLTLKKNYFF